MPLFYFPFSMASFKLLPTIFLLSLLSYTSFTQANCPPPPTPTPSPKPTPPTPTPSPKPTPPTPTPSPKPTPPTPTPSPKPKPTPPTPKVSPPPAPKASCPPPSPPSPKGSCPKDTLKLGVCAKILGLVNIVVGTPPSSECCALIKDLADLEAALCLCTAIKANVLGVNLNVPVTLSAILSACQKTVPSGFKCS